jgi:Flp pilus assembly secretin CpaC
MPSWFAIRNELDATCHATFPEPASYAHSDGTGAREVTGVLTQATERATLDDDVGYESTTPVYELRKLSATPALTASDFRRQGRLTLDSGQVFVVAGVRQEDTLIFLDLAPVE